MSVKSCASKYTVKAYAQSFQARLVLLSFLVLPGAFMYRTEQQRTRDDLLGSACHEQFFSKPPCPVLRCPVRDIHVLPAMCVNLFWSCPLVAYTEGAVLMSDITPKVRSPVAASPLGVLSARTSSQKIIRYKTTKL